jgi:RND superfamily putative drug exporter
VFERFGVAVVRWRIQVLVGSFVLLVIAGALGGGVVDRLTSGGFSDPDWESSQAADLLESEFGAAEPNFVLLVTAPSGQSVDASDIARIGAGLTESLAHETGVQQAGSYWTLGSPAALRSDDGSSALVLARLSGDEDQVKKTAGALGPKYRDFDGAVAVRIGGLAETYRQMSETIEHDLKRAEALTLPRTLVALTIVFGGAIAALLPVALGVVAILGTLFVLFLITGFTDVSIFALNLITALGLGLAIDYSLLVVTRFREELAAGGSAHGAVVRSVCTAGRTVFFSALTVALSLSALLVFPLAMLRSFAYAGIAVSLLAAAGALVVLPALLALLGHRIEALSVSSLRRRMFGRRGSRRHQAKVRGRHRARLRSMWGRVAQSVVARPLPVAVVGVALLLALGAPFLSVRFGLNDDRALPAGLESRQVGDVLRQDFGARVADSLFVVSADEVSGDALEQYAAALSRLPNVVRVDSSIGSYADGAQVQPAGPSSKRFSAGVGTWVQVVPDVEGFSSEGQDLARAVRAQAAPVPILVGGPSARLVDTGDALWERLPLAMAVIVLTVGFLIFLLTGSVLLPAKALVLNLLSLTATFGAMVWVFQEGHLQWLVGDFTVTGMLDVTIPVLMFCVAFGLSMDYEVFLLSRIREEYLRTGSNEKAIVNGLERTGRTITVAAILMALVFVSFAASGVTSLKLLGVGLALAVVVDATVVRGALVPAFMSLAGRANWWAPAPLRRFHQRFGLREDSEIAPGRPSARERWVAPGQPAAVSVTPSARGHEDLEPLTDPLADPPVVRTLEWVPAGANTH